MEKSTNYIYVEKIYGSLSEEQKKRISLDLFYNAICCFHKVPEGEIADMLMAYSDENLTKLETGFHEIREAVRKIQESVCEDASLDSKFASPDITDILFYQITNGLPIS